MEEHVAEIVHPEDVVLNTTQHPQMVGEKFKLASSGNDSVTTNPIIEKKQNDLRKSYPSTFNSNLKNVTQNIKFENVTARNESQLPTTKYLALTMEARGAPPPGWDMTPWGDLRPTHIAWSFAGLHEPDYEDPWCKTFGDMIKSFVVRYNNQNVPALGLNTNEFTHFMYSMYSCDRRVKNNHPDDWLEDFRSIFDCDNHHWKGNRLAQTDISRIVHRIPIPNRAELVGDRIPTGWNVEYELGLQIPEKVYVHYIHNGRKSLKWNNKDDGNSWEHHFDGPTVLKTIEYDIIEVRLEVEVLAMKEEFKEEYNKNLYGTEVGKEGQNLNIPKFNVSQKPYTMPDQENIIPLNVESSTGTADIPDVICSYRHVYSQYKRWLYSTASDWVPDDEGTDPLDPVWNLGNGPSGADYITNYFEHNTWGLKIWRCSGAGVYPITTKLSSQIENDRRNGIQTINSNDTEGRMLEIERMVREAAWQTKFSPAYFRLETRPKEAIKPAVVSLLQRNYTDAPQNSTNPNYPYAWSNYLALTERIEGSLSFPSSNEGLGEVTDGGIQKLSVDHWIDSSFYKLGRYVTFMTKEGNLFAYGVRYQDQYPMPWISVGCIPILYMTTMSAYSMRLPGPQTQGRMPDPPAEVRISTGDSQYSAF